MNKTLIALCFLFFLPAAAFSQTIGVSVKSSLPEIDADQVRSSIIAAMTKPGGPEFKPLPEVDLLRTAKAAAVGKKHDVYTVFIYHFFKYGQSSKLDMVTIHVNSKRKTGSRLETLSTEFASPCEQAVMMTWELMNNRYKISPQATPYLIEGRNLAQAGKFHEAGVRYNQAAQVQPEMGSIYREMGLYLEGAHDYPWAIEWYKIATTMDQKEFLSFGRIAQIEKSRGEIEAAAYYYELALDRSPRLPSLLLALGDCYGLLERYELAWRVYEQAFEVNPTDPAVAQKLVKILVEDNQWVKAAKYQMKYIKLRPDDNVARGDLLAYYMNAGNYGAASNMLESFLAARPDEVAWIEQLGHALEEMNDFDGAKKQFHRLLELVPDSTVARFGLAQIAYRQRDFKTAKTYLEYVLAVNPSDLEALRILSRINEMEQNISGAIETQKKIILYADGVKDGDLLRLFALGRKIDAMPLVEQAVNSIIPYKNRSDKRYLVMAMAEAMMADGRKTEAKSYIEARMNFLDRHAPAYLLLGRLLLEEGNFEKAEEIFKRAVFFTPDDSVAMTAGTLFYTHQKFTEAQLFFLFAINRDESNVKAQLQYLETCLLSGDLASAAWKVQDVSAMTLAPLFQQYMGFLEAVYAKLDHKDEFYKNTLKFCIELIEHYGPAKRLDLRNFRDLFNQKVNDPDRAELIALLELFEGKIPPEKFKAEYSY